MRDEAHVVLARLFNSPRIIYKVTVLQSDPDRGGSYYAAPVSRTGRCTMHIPVLALACYCMSLSNLISSLASLSLVITTLEPWNRKAPSNSYLASLNHSHSHGGSSSTSRVYFQQLAAKAPVLRGIACRLRSVDNHVMFQNALDHPGF